MKLLSLTVEHFRCVRKSTLEFGAGLNVLYGPNDLGKSSLAAAIRAALLLQVSSREHEEFLAWDSAGDPYVELVFESEPQRIWRVKKTFGNHPQAFLEESRDGVDFHVDARGRDVDGRLSEILRWGLAPPGPKGRPRGMPVTFLSTALMAQQDHVAAIFGQALSSDSDESGKKRLIDALHAAAEDPLFKAVLHQVQERFDEAFLSSGQRRRGKDSPWLKLRDQIQQAEEEERECNEQLQKTGAIESELQDLLSRRLECQEAVRVALEVFGRADDEYARGNQRAEISGRLSHCKKQWADITAVLEKMAASGSRVEELSQRVARLVLDDVEAKTSLTELSSRAEAAKEILRAQCEDRLRERELKQATLERRKAEILGEQARNDANLSRVRAVKTIAERAEQIESELRVLANTLSHLGQEHEESAEAVRIAEGREAALLNLGQHLRSTAAQRGIEEAEKGLAQIDTWREEARRRRSEAIAVEIDVNAVKLPTPAELENISRLEQRLQVARARLEVGLNLRVEPKREIRLSYRSDGGQREASLLREVPFERNASREIEIELEGVAALTVSGGAADAREAVEQLQAQWQAEAQPVLVRAGVAKLDALSEAVNQRSRHLEEIREARDAAAALDQRVSDQRDWARLRGEYQEELVTVDKALERVDRAALETTASDLSIGDVPGLEAHLGKLRSARPKLVATEQAWKGRLLEANASIQEKQRALSAAHQELVTAQLGLDGDWNALLPKLLGSSSVLAEELKAITSELQSLVDDTDKTVAEAREALDRAEQARSDAQSNHERVAEELRSTEKSRASAGGELKTLQEAASNLDEGAARRALKAVEAELDGIAAPAREVTGSMVTEARSAVQSAEGALREIEDEIQSKRGALHHVGGQVARDRMEDAREALRLVRERERIVETDYGGWALLRETLLEAEQEEGVHLGKVLGDPILKRFGDLTSGRYGKIALGPDLETDTISVAGEGRAVASLSIGTRDQLSIIFRLTLAEQLGSAVVLDDQLTQSDDGRMAWLRDLIRQMATNIQILVFTCKPGDYLIPSELKPSKKADRVNAFVRPVDLAQVIERSGATESGRGIDHRK